MVYDHLLSMSFYSYYSYSLLQPGRFTRASNSPNLAYTVKVPRNYFGTQAFVYAAPAFGNKLPVNIRSLKSLLNFRKQFKSYLFKHA